MILCNVLYIFFVWENCRGKNRISQIFIPEAVNYPFPSLIVPAKFEIYSIDNFFYKVAYLSCNNFYQYSLW